MSTDLNKRREIVRFTLAAAFLFFGPLIAIPLLVKFDLRAWAIAAAIYALPGTIALALVARPFCRLLRAVVSGKNADALLDRWHDEFLENQPNIAVLQRSRKFLVSRFMETLDLLWLALLLPVFALHMSLGLTGRVRWIWQLPVDLYTL